MIENLEEFETEEIETKERNTFVFKFVKIFGEKINRNLISEIISNIEYLRQIAECELLVADDDVLYSLAKPIYPNIKEIKNKKDRELLLRMLLEGNPDYLTAEGYGLIQSYLQSQSLLFYIFHTWKDKTEITGFGRVAHLNKYAVSVNIGLRGTHRQRGLSAFRLCKYFREELVKQLRESGYEQATTITLTNNHSALVRKIQKTEYNIILEKLKETATPDTVEKTLKDRANRELSGFKFTGTILYRPFEGRKTKELHWSYDLGQNEFFHE